MPFRVSFDPEDLRIEGNPFRMNPALCMNDNSLFPIGAGIHPALK